ncbi:hypothetical protein ACNOYE_10645 [Nannocystaceae bacterium ST9]
MDPTPPSSCDYVVAGQALDAAWEASDAVRPACESACRVDTCRSIAVQSAVSMYYQGYGDVGELLAEHCEQTVDACLAVTGVVVRYEPIEALGLALPAVEEVEPSDVPEPDTLEPDPIDPEQVDACDRGDAAACFALVDIDAVMGDAWEISAARERALDRWQQACELEPMVYCRGLATAIEYASDDEGCGA